MKGEKKVESDGKKKERKWDTGKDEKAETALKQYIDIQRERESGGEREPERERAREKRERARERERQTETER